MPVKEKERAEVSEFVKEPHENFGQFIKRIRIARKYNLVHAANVSGVPRQTISGWENGLGFRGQGPQEASIIALAKAYRIDPQLLLDAASIRIEEMPSEAEIAQFVALLKDLLPHERRITYDDMQSLRRHRPS